MVLFSSIKEKRTTFTLIVRVFERIAIVLVFCASSGIIRRAPSKTAVHPVYTRKDRIAASSGEIFSPDPPADQAGFPPDPPAPAKIGLRNGLDKRNRMWYTKSNHLHEAGTERPTNSLFCALFSFFG